MLVIMENDMREKLRRTVAKNIFEDISNSKYVTIFSKPLYGWGNTLDSIIDAVTFFGYAYVTENDDEGNVSKVQVLHNCLT